MFRKLVVAFIATWHTHDGSCSIARQHIFTNPHLNLSSIEWIDRVRTREASRNLLYLSHAIHFRAALYILQIFFNFFFLLRTGNFFYEFVFGGYYHEVNTEDGVGAGGEDGEDLTPRPPLQRRGGA